MKNFNKRLVGLGLMLGLSISLAQAAVYDAEYGTVTGTSTTEYDYDVSKDGAFNAANGPDPVVSYKGYATTFGGTGVDSDSLMASADFNSSDANEQSFIEAVTGETLTGYSQIFPANYTLNVDTATGLSTLSANPGIDDLDGGYFMLKFGDGGVNDSHWIFENNSPFNAFVWLSEISFGNNSVLGLSHFAMAGDSLTPGDGTQVPLPAAVWLFGSALMGLVGFGRKKVA